MLIILSQFGGEYEEKEGKKKGREEKGGKKTFLEMPIKPFDFFPPSLQKKKSPKRKEGKKGGERKIHNFSHRISIFLRKERLGKEKNDSPINPLSPSKRVSNEMKKRGGERGKNE